MYLALGAFETQALLLVATAVGTLVKSHTNTVGGVESDSVSKQLELIRTVFRSWTYIHLSSREERFY